MRERETKKIRLQSFWYWTHGFNAVTQACPTLYVPKDCVTPGLSVHHQCPELTQTHVHWVSDAIQPFQAVSSPSPPSFNLSQHQDFFFPSESVLCIRWPMYWSFSFSMSPSNEYSELISFRMDCLDFLEVRGTLKSLLQHHSSKASILQHSAFFMVQLSHPYMTTGKTISLSRWILAGKVMSLDFNMLSTLVLVFLPRSKSLLISWPQSSSANFGAQENKVCHSFHCFPNYLPWDDRTRCHNLSFLNIEF